MESRHGAKRGRSDSTESSSLEEEEQERGRRLRWESVKEREEEDQKGEAGSTISHSSQVGPNIIPPRCSNHLHLQEKSPGVSTPTSNADVRKEAQLHPGTEVRSGSRGEIQLNGNTGDIIGGTAAREGMEHNG